MFDIITIGSATRDVLLKAEGFELRKHEDSPSGAEQCFPLGSKIEIKEVVFATGGGAANASVTFARQGLKTACISVVGQDFNGQEILAELKKEKVETKYFQKHDDDFTAYSVILVHPSAERTILSYKGEGQHFDLAKVPFNKIKSKWLFLNSLGGNYDLLKAIVEHGFKNKIKMAINPGSKELAYGLEKLTSLIKDLDIVVMNQEEAAGLLSLPFEQEEEIFKKLNQIFSGTVVMTRGPKGVIVSDKKNIYRAGTPDSPVVERTGAGDAWCSGFVSEFIKSDHVKSQSDHVASIVKAIQFATANASSVVTKFGSRAGILKEGDWGPWPLVEVKTLKV
ncbi:MAG: carbohydrate kinase family protein [Candidatus Yanofskybacteria bacterium]|nr:carbohydrate kinase family protein [Candidatus Yanofskybacteria bacterium]